MEGSKNNIINLDDGLQPKMSEGELKRDKFMKIGKSKSEVTHSATSDSSS